MLENFNLLSQEIFAKIKSSNNILLHLHPSPDCDSVGSALAMMWVLKSLGKQVTVISGDSPKQNSFEQIPGYDQIISKNYFELDLTIYDLFISLDSASVGQISKIDQVNFPPTMYVCVIDHHKSNTEYGQLNSVDPSYSSNCQLLFDLINSWGVEITPSIATCLIIGIYTDSGGFRYPPTNYQTFETGAKLTKIAPDYNQVIASFLDHNSLGRVKYLGQALSRLQLYFDNKVAIAIVPHQVLLEQNIEPSDTEKSDVANYLKSISGVEIGISFCEKSPNQISISFRSRDGNRYDVSKIAAAINNGGGHRAAAGTMLEGSVTSALEILLSAISSTYPEFK